MKKITLITLMALLTLTNLAYGSQNPDLIVADSLKNYYENEWKKGVNQYNTVEDMCIRRFNSPYDEKTRTCTRVTPSDKEQYLFLRKIILPKDAEFRKKQEKLNKTRWEAEAKIYKKSLGDLCDEIEQSYAGHLFDDNFNNETLECSVGNAVGQMKYNIMRPYLTEQHQAVLNQRESENKEAQAKKEAQIQEEQRILDARKGNTYPLEYGKDYQCEGYVMYLLSRVKLNAVLSVGRSSMTFTTSYMGIETTYDYNFIEGYDGYDLFRGLDEDGKLVRAKVFTEKGINGGNINFETDGIGFYCTEK